MNLHADATERLAIYRGLQARNRIVAILRVGVPALGVVAFAALMLQIYISSRISRFGVGQIVMSSDSVTVETPEYSGLLDDGTAYRVSAIAAQAAVDATDRIALSEAALTMLKPDGVTIEVNARSALLDTTNQVVEIAGVAEVSNSLGTTGLLRNSVFDYERQYLTGNGPVSIDYEDGTELEAEGLTYDATAMIWTFTRATVTLPDTPRASEPAMESP
ncbi:hypothetical protein [Devosia ginsengisoli]|uniref:LPS export ABC transporter periplasmic protein LptC n=1 Tax=Devosia ginsengisoli TaxID=400770 RepID=A0A5B8LY66_9HYPH|nr:hypothetical protein [Devosia ginsengisoli]QDZ12382.1 hypothetical protein FPZ08_17475 [Devosia ginsengisoli]